MSLHDQAEDLLHSLQSTGNLLRRLEQALRQRRLVWVAARPRELREGLEDLDVIARDLDAAQTRRDQVLAGLAAMLPLPAARPGCALHVSVPMIARHLPAATGRRLQAAADEAVGAARAVRVETALGGRLLQFTQRAHDSWLPGLAGLAGGPVAYDRHARKVQGTLLPASRGALIDGRL